MTSADASTMSNDDQRLADILSLLSAIDERLPKRRVKAAAAVPSIVESEVTPAEKPKRARKPAVSAAKANAAAAKAAEPLRHDEEEDNEPTPAPAKPTRKPRVKKATAPADSE
jgi:short-subunit dehydrogenase